MTSQKVNNHTMEDLKDKERDESPVAEVRIMKIIVFYTSLKRSLKRNTKMAQ
jgi:hypothetical protein